MKRRIRLTCAFAGLAAALALAGCASTTNSVAPDPAVSFNWLQHNVASAGVDPCYSANVGSTCGSWFINGVGAFPSYSGQCVIKTADELCALDHPPHGQGSTAIVESMRTAGNNGVTLNLNDGSSQTLSTNCQSWGVSGLGLQCQP